MTLDISGIATAPFRGNMKTRLSISLLVVWLCGLQVAADSFSEQVPVILPPFPQPYQPIQHSYERQNFQLRHIYHHGTRRHPGLHRKLDIAANAPLWMEDEDTHTRSIMPELWARPQTMHIQRLADRSPDRMDALQKAGQARGSPLALPLSAWTVDAVKGPNYTDKDTVLAFARMAADAYVEEPYTGDWEDVSGSFNYTDDFGWKSDGLRGHIFADQKNHTVVIALKGTSPAVFDGTGSTTNDKVNDNLFFSCCCGQGGPMGWLEVCDCKTSVFTCNSTCLRKSLMDKERYYDAAKSLYLNVTALYPNSDIWLSGHSLGGAFVSFLSKTYGVPAITFGAPGDALPASRLGLPIPPVPGNGSLTGTVQYGHTADSIFEGSCSGWSSSCSLGGYAMETGCHTGLECRYDTVKDKGWHNNMLNHRIRVTISVLESYPELATCVPVLECVDCYKWKFFESNSSDSKPGKSTTKASFTQTRTETCKTPGWWGCLDESTTTSVPASTTSTTTTSSTSTCETPGWFGCRDPTTTTATTEVQTTSPTLDTTCEFLGLFFCHPCSTTTSSAISTRTARPSITPAPTATAPTQTTTRASSTTSCRHPSLFWGCRDKYKRKHGGEDGGKKPPEDPWSIFGNQGL